jgi:hypothetical protein
MNKEELESLKNLKPLSKNEKLSDPQISIIVVSVVILVVFLILFALSKASSEFTG